MRNNNTNPHAVKKRPSTSSGLKSAKGGRMVLAATCQATQPRETGAAKRQA